MYGEKGRLLLLLLLTPVHGFACFVYINFSDRGWGMGSFDLACIYTHLTVCRVGKFFLLLFH